MGVGGFYLEAVCELGFHDSQCESHTKGNAGETTQDERQADRDDDMDGGVAGYAGENGEGDGSGGRPRRQAARAARPAVKKASRGLLGGKKRESDEDDEEDDDEEEEEEEEEEEIEDMDAAEEEAVRAAGGGSRSATNARSGSTDMQAFEKGAMVRIVRTSDVDQRVPHTVGKIGLIEEVPQHPNTWFKVRIRDGDVVYKYRPSALMLVGSEEDQEDLEDDGQQSYEEEEEDAEEAPARVSSRSIRGGEDVGGDDTDGVEESEGEQKEADDEDEEEMEIDTRVRVQLATLARRERDLKKYEGKLGVIIASEPDGFKVQLDSEDIITIKQKHLVAAPDEPRVDEDVSGANDSDVETPKGHLLSDLDPDMWIDRRCRVNVGKFKGRFGRVLRSGNGWVQLRLDNSNENTAKRAYELTLLEDMDTIKELYAKSLAKRREHGIGSRGPGGDDGDDDDDDDGDDGLRSGGEDNMTAEDSQGEESGGTRSRRLATRGNYGISWIEKKVYLPNRKGFGVVKRADRETCTVEVGSSKMLRVFKKKDLELMEEDPSKAGRGQRNRNNNAKAKEKLGLPEGVTLMGTSAARYAAFQDQVKKFIMRRREKFKKRPNLLGWKAEFEAKLRSSEIQDMEDPSVIDLFVVPQCEICGVEKEELNGECWNVSCPRCVNFDVEGYTPSEDSFARMPMLPFPSERITNTVCLRAVESQRKRKRRQNVSPVAADNITNLDEEGNFVATPRNLKRQASADSVKSEAKKSKKDGSKPKKVKSDDKKSKKASGKVSPSGADSKKSSSAKKNKPDSVKSSPTRVSQPHVDTSDTAFRPQYDSMFSR